MSFFALENSKTILNFAKHRAKIVKNMKIYNFLAFDLGATSGRSILGRLVDGKIEIKELTRFKNGILELHGKYYIKACSVGGQYRNDITIFIN